MIDENVLREGANEVDVFAVRGTGRRSRLVLLGGNDSATRAVAASSG
jgi:hypothetical protein